MKPNFIDSHLEKILSIYTRDNYFEPLKIAKEKYISITGKLDEDQDEFESRMNCFNEWYIFQYRNPKGERIIEDYIKREKLDPELALAFLNVTYSLFEFDKTSMKGQICLHDILHDEKVLLCKEQKNVGLVEDDVFIGRILKYQGEFVLLRGLCTIPNSIQSTLKKQSKKIRNLCSLEDEINFLMNLESLKTKSMHYSHIEPSKIFVFN